MRASDLAVINGRRIEQLGPASRLSDARKCEGLGQ
jgi:hypothetical protein